MNLDKWLISLASKLTPDEFDAIYTSFKSRKKAIAYIDKLLSSEIKLDTDAVLITIREILLGG